MSRSTVLKSKCAICGKVAKAADRFVMGEEVMITLECGHAYVEKLTLEGADAFRAIRSKTKGFAPFEFQVTSAEFLEQGGLRGLIGHEMGLGKTVIECLMLAQHREMLPALIAVKSGLRHQWFHEILEWTGMVAQIITSSKEKPYLDIFPITIVSLDTLRNLNWGPEIMKRYKHVCIDECQMIKNSSSKRTQALRQMAADTPSIVGLSGTAIKNNPAEYFTILNFLDPERFFSEAHFQAHHCLWNEEKTKIIGLKDPDHFHDITKHIVLRYTREQVMPDLPKIFRQFRHADMNKDDTDAYQRVIDEFSAFFEGVGGAPKREDFTNILAYFARMRQITGLSKVTAACDFVEEFLLSTDRKIVVFVHHKLVGELILSKLTEVCRDGAFAPPLMLTSSLTGEERHEVVTKFKEPGNRIMIASTLAAGEGLNLQFCSDCLIVERQWNPANEEQAEARFPRPGTTASQVNASYLIASGTIDEFLTELVEKKRKMMKEALDNESYAWEESSLMMELARVIFESRKKLLG